MKANPHLGSSLSSLLKRGIEEKDIVKICRISEMYPGGIVAVIQKYKKENEKLRAENKSLCDKVEDLQILNNKAETIGNHRDDDKAGEDEDETRSNSIDEKKDGDFMNNESLSDTHLDE